MKNKKLMSLLLIPFFAVTAAFGCNSDGGETNTPPPSSSETETPGTGGTGGTGGTTPGGETDPGTGGTTPEAKYDADKLLTALRGDLTVTAELTEKPADADPTTYNLSTYIGEGEYYLVKTAGTSSSSLHFFKNAQGKTVTKSVNNHNEVIETPYTAGEVDDYDKMLDNPFNFVETSMMEHNDGVVTIDPTAQAGASTVGTVMFSMLANAIATPTSITLELDDNFNPLSISVEGKNEHDLAFTYEGQFAAKADLDIPAYPYPSEGAKPLLTQAFDKIKDNNYTYTVYSSAVGEGKTPHSVGQVTPQGVIYTDNLQQKVFGYIDEPTGHYLTEVEGGSDGGKKVLKGTANFWEDKTLANDKLPSMDFSTDLFEEKDGSFTLRSGSYNLETLLPDAMCNGTYQFMLGGSLTITPAADLSTVEYTYSIRNLFGQIQDMRVVVSDFGTTELPYDLSTDYVAYNPVAAKWSDVQCQGNGVLGFLTIFPEGDLDADIPFYKTEVGEITWLGTKMGASNVFEIEVQYASKEEADEDLKHGGFLDTFIGLESMGWDYDFMGSTDDATVYTKGNYKMTISGEEGFFGSGYSVYIDIEAKA